MATTKPEITQDILHTIARANHESKIEGEALWANVERLMFFGAGVTELRGLDDTGLCEDTIIQIASFALPSRAYPMMSAYLDELYERTVTVRMSIVCETP